MSDCLLFLPSEIEIMFIYMALSSVAVWLVMLFISFEAEYVVLHAVDQTFPHQNHWHIHGWNLWWAITTTNTIHALFPKLPLYSCIIYSQCFFVPIVLKLCWHNPPKIQCGMAQALHSHETNTALHAAERDNVTIHVVYTRSAFFLSMPMDRPFTPCKLKT